MRRVDDHARDCTPRAVSRPSSPIEIREQASGGNLSYYKHPNRGAFRRPSNGAPMSRKLLWILLALATAAQGAALDAGTSYPPELQAQQQESRAAHIAAEVLS